MTPESLLRDALHARDEWRYADIVAVVDPISMREYFTAFCQATQPRTLAVFAARYPDLSGDLLAQHFAHWVEASGDPTVLITQGVAGVSTHAELIALTPESFLERTLTANDPRYYAVEPWHRLGREVPVAWRTTPPNVHYDIIGSVKDGDDFAHVLYRTRRGDTVNEVDRVHVERETLRRQADGSWRFLAGWPPNLASFRNSAFAIMNYGGLLDDEIA